MQGAMLIAIQEYLQERNFYQPYDIKLRNKGSFDIQPTNPQADIVATGCCEYILDHCRWSHEAPRK